MNANCERNVIFTELKMETLTTMSYFYQELQLIEKHLNYKFMKKIQQVYKTLKIEHQDNIDLSVDNIVTAQYNHTVTTAEDMYIDLTQQLLQHQKTTNEYSLQTSKQEINSLIKKLQNKLKTQYPALTQKLETHRTAITNILNQQNLSSYDIYTQLTEQLTKFHKENNQDQTMLKIAVMEMTLMLKISQYSEKAVIIIRDDNQNITNYTFPITALVCSNFIYNQASSYEQFKNQLLLVYPNLQDEPIDRLYSINTLFVKELDNTIQNAKNIQFAPENPFEGFDYTNPELLNKN